MCIPIIFNVEVVNSQNECTVGAARRGGVNPAIIPGKRIGRSSRAVLGSAHRFSEGTSCLLKQEGQKLNNMTGLCASVMRTKPENNH